MSISSGRNVKFYDSAEKQKACDIISRLGGWNMNQEEIYRTGLKAIKDSTIDDLAKLIIRHEFSETSTELTPDSSKGRDASTLLTLVNLFDLTDETGKEKLGTVLNILLLLSIETLQYRIFSVAINAIGKTECDVLLDSFVESIDKLVEIVKNVDSKFSSDYQDEAIALLHGAITRYPEIQAYFNNWFWTNPTPVEKQFFLSIFSGLVELSPTSYPKLLLRFTSINDELEDGEKFDSDLPWMHILDLCSKDIVEKGLLQLPPELTAYFRFLQESYPEIYHYDV